MPDTTVSQSVVLTPYLTADQINARLDEVAQTINSAYANEPEVVIIAILKGSFMFLADLVRRLTFPCHVEFVRLASYEGTSSTGSVKPVDLSLPSLNGKAVLVVEDIVDTGLTLHFFMKYLTSVHEPKSIRLAVFLDKKMARQYPTEPDFVGFEIENQFVVGYGLDADGLYRNLPHVCVLSTAD